MKRGKRRVILKPHFIKRWCQRIGCDKPGVIKNRLHSALVNKPIRRLMGDKFEVEVQGRRAVCVIDATGSWVFLTVLDPWMYGGRFARQTGSLNSEGQGGGIG